MLAADGVPGLAGNLTVVFKFDAYLPYPLLVSPLLGN